MKPVKKENPAEKPEPGEAVSENAGGETGTKGEDPSDPMA